MTISPTEVFKVNTMDKQTPSVELVFLPSDKKITLSGLYVEAQYAIDENFILFVSNGTIYDEVLHIYFLNSATEILDSAEVFCIFSTASVDNLRIITPNKLCFSFFNETENWTLTVLEKPKTQLWANNSLVERKSPFLHKTYFKLERTDN